MALLSRRTELVSSAESGTGGSRPGTDEQRAIWAAMRDQGHMMVKAVAGSGKTYTLLGCAEAYGQPVEYLGFNKSVQQEIEGKRVANLKAQTYHGRGLSMLTEAMGKLRVDQNRVYGLIDAYTRLESRKGAVKALVNAAKQYGLPRPASGYARGEAGGLQDESKGQGKGVGAGEDLRTLLGEILDKHGIDVEAQGTSLERAEAQVIELAEKVLGKCGEVAGEGWDGVVDFADMVWLPYQLGLKRRVGVILSDESQDLNICQQYLGMQAEKSVVVGDPHQAIYAWRGADSRSMDTMGDMLRATGEVREFTLSTTWRCPKAVVEHAQQWVPHLKAKDGAIEGKVEWVDSLGAKPGDLVLSRTNQPVVQHALEFMRRGIPVEVVGRDISAGLEKLKKVAEWAGAVTIEQIKRAAEEYTEEKAKKLAGLPGGRGVARLNQLMSNLDCFVMVCEGCQSLWDVENKIWALFRDPGGARVRLSTVHRAKGLEAKRVWVVRPDLMPAPWASKGWELEQEKNLQYVAATRALEELYYVQRGDMSNEY